MQQSIKHMQPHHYIFFHVALYFTYVNVSKTKKDVGMRLCIRESVDSLCRDGADTPISLNMQNCSKLPNAAVISLFRHITWSWSSSVPDNSFKVGKITRYSDTRKTAKTPISPSSSSSSTSSSSFSSVDRPTTKLVQVLTFISAQNNCFLVCA